MAPALPCSTERQRGRSTASQAFPKCPFPAVDAATHPEGLGVKVSGHSPAQARLLPGTGQGAMALSEAPSVLTLQKRTGLTLGLGLPSHSARAAAPARPPLGSRSLCLPPAQPPRSRLPMTICFMSSASLPVSRLSLYSCAVSSDAAFFPITSCLIQTFLKAPFHTSPLPRVAPAGLGPHRGPSSSKWGRSLPLPTPHSRSHNTHFHIKSHPWHPGHKSFQKADKMYSSGDE